jgi:hypothetical protein
MINREIRSTVKLGSSQKHLPLITPYLFFLPRTALPSTTTFLSEPTMAKGIKSCQFQTMVNQSLIFWLHLTSSSSTYTNAFVQCLLLLIIFLTLVRVKTNVVENQLLLDLRRDDDKHRPRPCPKPVPQAHKALMFLETSWRLFLL